MNVTCTKDVVQLPKVYTSILTIASIIVLIFNLITNMVVITCLIKTKQYVNSSYKLILHLSLSDVGVALFSQPLFIIFLNYRSILKPCTALIFFDVSLFFPRLSSFTIVLLGIDRYLKIQYPSRYNEMMTPARIRKMLIIIWIIAVVNEGLITSLHYLKKEERIRVAGVFIHIIITLILVSLHLRVIGVSHHLLVLSGDPDLVRAGVKVITLATRIIALYLVLIIPLTVSSILRMSIYSKLNDNQKAILMFSIRMGLILAHSNSTGNAILFLISNSQVKNMFRKILKKNSNEIHPNAVHSL